MRDEYDFSKGRRGAVIPSTGKTRLTIMLDDDVIEGFRARAESAGAGYQTLMNAVLRESIFETKEKPKKHVTVAMLRRVLREELHASLVANAVAEPAAIDQDQAPIGLVRKQHLCKTGDHERVEEPGDKGQRDEYHQSRAKLGPHVSLLRLSAKRQATNR